MLIQYISDIHLEFYNLSKIIKLIPSAPILCLAGDIGNPLLENYEIFLKWCSENYKKIFIISGNHEYYNKKYYIHEVDKIIQNKVNLYDNITFLNNKIEIYENFTFIGCTLWSSIPTNIKRYELNSFNDFKKIRSLTIEKYDLLFAKNLLFIKNALTNENNKNIICLTHHMPSYNLISEKYKDSDLNYMFASNIENIFNDNIKLWICGHSHDYNKKIINNVICTLNPYGYPNENTNIEEIISKTIEL